MQRLKKKNQSEKDFLKYYTKPRSQKRRCWIQPHKPFKILHGKTHNKQSPKLNITTGTILTVLCHTKAEADFLYKESYSSLKTKDQAYRKKWVKDTNSKV